MPEWLNVRKKQLEVMDIFNMQQVAWRELMRDCTGWVEIKRAYGAEAVQQSYRKLVGEGVSADTGLIWSLWDSSTPVAHPTKL